MIETELRVAFYNMLQKGDKLGKIDMDSIVRKVTPNRRIQITNVAMDKITSIYIKQVQSLIQKKMYLKELVQKKNRSIK